MKKSNATFGFFGLGFIDFMVCGHLGAYITPIPIRQHLTLRLL